MLVLAPAGALAAPLACPPHSSLAIPVSPNFAPPHDVDGDALCVCDDGYLCVGSLCSAAPSTQAVFVGGGSINPCVPICDPPCGTRRACLLVAFVNWICDVGWPCPCADALQSSICTAPNVCSVPPSLVATNTASVADVGLPSQCTWVWLEFFQMYFCAAGDSELIMTRRKTPPNFFTFTIPAQSIATNCFSFAYLPGQRVVLSLAFDQPIRAAVNLATVYYATSFEYCQPPTELVLPGRLDPIDFTYPCGGPGWYTRGFSLVSIAGTKSTKTTTVTVTVNGACVDSIDRDTYACLQC